MIFAHASIKVSALSALTKSRELHHGLILAKIWLKIDWLECDLLVAGLESK